MKLEYYLSCLVVLTLPLLSAAVTIHMYPVANHDCDGDDHHSCTRIAEGECCHKFTSNGHVLEIFGSAEYIRLGFFELGRVYQNDYPGHRLEPCHLQRAEKGGDTDHAACVNIHAGHNPAHYEHLTGAKWARNHGSGKRSLSHHYAMRRDVSEPVNCTRTVLPDIATIGGHHFSVNYHVPKADSDRLSELVGSRTTYADIPEDLKQWELKGVADDDIFI